MENETGRESGEETGRQKWGCMCVCGGGALVCETSPVTSVHHLRELSKARTTFTLSPLIKEWAYPNNDVSVCVWGVLLCLSVAITKHSDQK